MSPNTKSQEALLGTVLEGLYHIDNLVGEGGMGSVYSATHLRLGRRVAVKVMAREFATHEEALARFHREAQVTSALGHPHIVQVVDFSVTPDGCPFIVMEFLEGEDLDHRLRRVSKLTAKQMVHVVGQVASALTATHKQAIVHRDLKPGNIFLLDIAGAPDFVKVLDFGISKVRTAATRLTRVAEIIGTPNYMSPEQALGRIDEVDERTDQWALACIAWECLIGRSLFQGDNAQSILFQIVHEPIPPLTGRSTELSAAIERVLRKALTKDKAGRFDDVNALAAALEEAAAGGASVPPPWTSPTELMESPLSTPEPDAGSADVRSSPSTLSHSAGQLDDVLDEMPTRPKWVWGAGAGVAIALLVAGVLLFRRPNETRPASASPGHAAPAPPAAAVAPPPAVPAPPTAPAFVPPIPAVAASPSTVSQPEEKPKTDPRSAAIDKAGEKAIEKDKLHALPHKTGPTQPAPPKAATKAAAKVTPKTDGKDHNYTDL
jgi:serine/threonine protein kinase